MKSSLTRSEWDAVYRAKALLDKHYVHRITLPQLSVKFGIHQHKLQKGFKALTRCTVHYYVRRLRIRYAQNRLLQTNRPIKDLAVQSGFRDLSAFNRAFKEVIGRPPSQWKKDTLENNGMRNND